MNSKTAKRLRKMALAISKEVEAQSGESVPTTDYFEDIRNRKKFQTQARGENGGLLYEEDGTATMTMVDCSLGTISNKERSLRGIYKALKTEASKGSPVKVAA